MRLTRIWLVAVATIAAAGIAYAAGQYDSFPTVGGAARGSIPAGPSNVTGLETVPADTNLAGGAAPQTVTVPLRTLGAGPIFYNLCTNVVCPSPVQIPNGANGVMLDFASTITSATINLPLNPVDGQRVSISSPVTVTSLTIVPGAGTTLAATTPTILTASTTVPQGYEYLFVASTAKWYRIS